MNELQLGLDISEVSCPVHATTLSNGLTVLLVEDHRRPLVEVSLTYLVGSRDDPAGRHGMAHLAEHLYFSGTPRVPAGDLDRLAFDNGSFNNASTGRDRTSFIHGGTSNLLETFLWVEADRMESFPHCLGRESLEGEKSVVINELLESRQHPYDRFLPEELRAYFPPGHPYRHCVVGTQEEVEGASLEDVCGFVGRAYTPNNAHLVVSGDLDAGPVLERIQEWFEPIPSSTGFEAAKAPPLIRPYQPRLQVPGSLAVDRLEISWPVNARGPRLKKAYDLVCRLLEHNAYPYLHDRLVKTGLAVELDANYWQADLCQGVELVVWPAPGQDLAAVEEAAFHTFAEFGRTGPSPEAVDERLRWTQLTLADALSDGFQVARWLGWFLHLYGSHDCWESHVQGVMAVTAEDVREAAMTLRPENAGVVSICGREQP